MNTRNQIRSLVNMQVWNKFCLGINDELRKSVSEMVQMDIDKVYTPIHNRVRQQVRNLIDNRIYHLNHPRYFDI